MRAVGTTVIVAVLEEGERMMGSIIVPDTAAEKTKRGKVKSVGKGVKEIKKGEVVHFRPHAGDELDGDLRVLDFDEILAVEN